MSYDLNQTVSIPPTNRAERYYCNQCDETFERIYPRVLACLVIHPPGTCCHFGDTIVTKRQLHKETELQQTVKEERQGAINE